ncbi:hypothetical protein SEUCBS139899_005858 [Sporothrix eucalyptigena]|uniref:Acyl-CoA thioesterase-like N-terminal HotDog domain-containing protein n=1 Tax=Sporothrix eucalyptigena TaxID=1812306 RepID=A0ABP0D422_9PEZI
MARRKTFQEAMQLVQLPSTVPPPSATSPDNTVTRYMSQAPAWLPGSDLQAEMRQLSDGRPGFPVYANAFGGHVYAQSVLAVCKSLESTIAENNLGLHTIHGYFTAAGRPDRPFVYEVAVLTRGRSFLTARVEARQPLRATRPTVDKESFILAEDTVFEEGDLGDLGFVCFTAIVSFVLPRPHSMGADRQEESVQRRFASILSQRAPASWDPSPPVDMDVLIATLDIRHIVGTFPMVDMKKVDMTAYNEDRPLHERRDLILYRLLAPLPSATAQDQNNHVLVHAYAADRNGLLMAANHLEFPINDKTASMSNTFVVHTNVADAQMVYRPHAETDNALDGWWIQEMCFPRAAAGRAIILNKIWSPSGVHVATEYQDGLCTAMEKAAFSFHL